MFCFISTRQTECVHVCMNASVRVHVCSYMITIVSDLKVILPNLHFITAMAHFSFNSAQMGRDTPLF